MMGMALSSLQRRNVDIPIDPMLQTPILPQLKDALFKVESL
jgi:hypothetical protein